MYEAGITPIWQGDFVHIFRINTTFNFKVETRQEKSQPKSLIEKFIPVSHSTHIPNVDPSSLPATFSMIGPNGCGNSLLQSSLGQLCQFSRPLPKRGFCSYIITLGKSLILVSIPHSLQISLPSCTCQAKDKGPNFQLK